MLLIEDRVIGAGEREALVDDLVRVAVFHRVAEMEHRAPTVDVRVVAVTSFVTRKVAL